MVMVVILGGCCLEMLGKSQNAHVKEKPRHLSKRDGRQLISGSWHQVKSNQQQQQLKAASEKLWKIVKNRRLHWVMKIMKMFLQFSTFSLWCYYRKFNLALIFCLPFPLPTLPFSCCCSYNLRIKWKFNSNNYSI